jgi:hypothetical protein
VDGLVTALVQGIEVGGRRVLGHFIPGDLLNVPIDYFPDINLPTEIRFAIDDAEIAAPFAINSSEDVMSILGTGDLRVENFRLDSGLMRGSIINSVNSLQVPNAYIRINGHIVRSAVVEPPRALEEGGSISVFAVPIRLSDFAETGLIVDLHVSGVEHPLANFTYTRSDPVADSRRLIEMDQKIRQLQKSTSLQIEILSDKFDQHLHVQQERIDAFIEYTISLVMSTMSDTSGVPDPAAFITALRQAGDSVRENNQVTTRPTAAAVASPAILPLDSSLFAFGWFDHELHENGNFRWMGQTALIRNPYVSRPVSKVELTINQVYGAHEPMLQAALDDQGLVTILEQRDKLFIVSFAAPEASGAVLGHSLQVESFATGCPAADHGTNDERTLSVAVTGVRFCYAENPV